MRGVHTEVSTDGAMSFRTLALLRTSTAAGERTGHCYAGNTSEKSKAFIIGNKCALYYRTCQCIVLQYLKMFLYYLQRLWALQVWEYAQKLEFVTLMDVDKHFLSRR
jgi:hypothetical protein